VKTYKDFCPANDAPGLLGRYAFSKKNDKTLVNQISSYNLKAAKDGKINGFNMSSADQFDGFLRRTEKEKNCKPSISLSKTAAKRDETIEVFWDCLPDGQEKYWYGLLIPGLKAGSPGVSFSTWHYAYGRTGSAQFKLAKSHHGEWRVGEYNFKFFKTEPRYEQIGSDISFTLQ